MGPSVRGSLTDDENVLHSPMCTPYFEPVNTSASVHSMHLLSTARTWYQLSYRLVKSLAGDWPLLLFRWTPGYPTTA